MHRFLSSRARGANRPSGLIQSHRSLASHHAERLRTLREMVDVIDEPAFVLRADGVIMTANDPLATLFNMEVESLFGEHLDLALGLDANDAYRVVAALFSGGNGGKVHFAADESRTGSAIELDASPMTLRKFDRAQFAFVRVRPDCNLVERFRELAMRLRTEHHPFASTIADHDALERDIAALEKLAQKDALTGLENRGSFDRHLNRILGQADREGKSAALILLDVDNFKALNDTWGHDRGDECLRRLASTLVPAARRPLDMVARVGGEEFAIILADCSLRDALMAAARVRLTVRDAAIPHPLGYVTLSVGVAASSPGQRRGASELYRTADQGLYVAKRNGKDRVHAGNLNE